jgi:hypothetical protein
MINLVMLCILSLQTGSKAATALAAFSRIFRVSQKSSNFFRGSFSRALTLTFPSRA